MIVWETVCNSIEAATQSRFILDKIRQLGGGDSNQAWRISGKDNRDYFVKLNTADRIVMFEAELAGLAAIADTQTIHVPQPITLGHTGTHSFLVLESLHLESRGNSRELGRQLAAMHRCHADRFGWFRNNTISLTPQRNSQADDWPEFWREQRLKLQLDLAARNNHGNKLQSLGRSVLDALPELLADHQPAPSLLHGDLWNGNHGYLRDGTPVIFDPATYFGDRETDIAMTELFGGFNNDFYATYQAVYPLENGYTKRKNLYNLYHILNHCNLFGSSYLWQAENLMQRLLAK